MKRLIILLILIFLTGFLISCNNKKVQSSRVENDITIDGLGNDWDNLSLTYNEDLKLAYGFANNDSALYFMIRFRDRNLIRMLSRRGMTLWLNDKNKKDKTIGIHYIDESMEAMMPGMRRSGSQAQSSAPVYIPSGIFTLARNDSTDLDIEIDNINGMDAAAKFEDGFYCFEFKVPFNVNNKIPYSINIPEKKKIKACFEISPMSDEDKEMMQQMMKSKRSGGGMPGGGGGMRGGGMGGGRGGGGMGRQMPDTGGEEVWMTVTLADSK